MFANTGNNKGGLSRSSRMSMEIFHQNNNDVTAMNSTTKVKNLGMELNLSLDQPITYKLYAGRLNKGDCIIFYWSIMTDQHKQCSDF